MNDLLAKSDIVTIHAPLTSATQNLLGARELRHMKDGALLVNTARAGIVREAALEKALLSGKLFDLPNVLTTPHIGSATFEANRRMGDMVVDNIIAFKDGNVPPNRVTAVDRVKFS